MVKKKKRPKYSVRKRKFKPLFKKFSRLRENVHNKKKLLKFRKKKWEILLRHYKKSLKWYKRFKPKKQNKYLITRFANRGTGYNKNYRDSLTAIRKVRLLYGGLSRKFIKKQIRNQIKKNYKNDTAMFIESLEKRLDVVLYRAKFCPSVRSAHQLIVHGKILVNHKEVKIKSYKLQTNDLISVKPKFYKLIENNTYFINKWPIPPKHLIINYKTMQIIFGDTKHINLSTMFTFHLNIEKILNKYI